MTRSTTRNTCWTRSERDTRVDQTIDTTTGESSPEQLAADSPDTPETGRRRQEAVEMTLAVSKPQLRVFCRSNTISRWASIDPSREQTVAVETPQTPKDRVKKLKPWKPRRNADVITGRRWDSEPESNDYTGAAGASSEPKADQSTLKKTSLSELVPDPRET